MYSIIKMLVSDILSFGLTSSRGGNDATNKMRESILPILSGPPTEYLAHPDYGQQWLSCSNAWNTALHEIAEQKGIKYNTTRVHLKGGRTFNYDADLSYYNESELIDTVKIEFKKGGNSIVKLPQFLSLQVKCGLFPETYDKFYYEKYIDKYIACDTEITEPKPDLALYLKCVSVINYNILPFFSQLKAREPFFKKEKFQVVNESITDYLNQYGAQLDLLAFAEKIRRTQTDKIYMLWSDERFYIDKILDNEMACMNEISIKNGNVIEVKSGASIYNLLLRWRNHKGILNPAWQISKKIK
jgi:hypothetical protein